MRMEKTDYNKDYNIADLPDTTNFNGLEAWRENYRHQPALEFVDSDSWQTEPGRRKVEIMISRVNSLS